jgi:tetratricopeptide (TPR) repeat protein
MKNLLRLFAALIILAIIGCASADLQRGRLAFSYGKYSDAIQYYDEAIKSDNLSSNDLETAYFNRGRAKCGMNDFDGAIADFSKALEMNPKIVGAYINRGYMKFLKKDIDGAIADDTQAIELSPNDELAYLDRGRAKREKGDFDGAIADYNKAIKIKPKYSTAYHNRGTVKLYKYDLDGAIADYNKAIEFDQKSPDRYCQRGLAKYFKENYDDAASDFEYSLKIDPRQIYTPLWLFLAREKNKKDGKTGLREHTIKYVDDDWPAQFTKLFLGQITPDDCLKLADHEDVRQDKEKKCETYFFLGEYFLLKGERTKAKEYFKKSIETGLKTFGTYLAADYELRIID